MEIVTAERKELQVSSIALASESEATVKKVTLKPPDKDALPGKAKRRNRLEACDSTYNRETEAQTLSGLFKFYQTENLDVSRKIESRQF